MNIGMNTLNEMCKKTYELDKEMHTMIINFVKANGNFIDTRNNTLWIRDIFGYTSDVKECPIIAVKVVDNSLWLLFDKKDGEIDTNMGKDEFKAFCLDEKNEDLFEICGFTGFGGDALLNATLYNLCKFLGEYVKSV